MTSIADDCAHNCLLPDGQSTLYDALPPFDEDLGGDVTAEELSLPPPLETIDEAQAGTGSSLPATPAERPCTFCPSSLPLPPATCPERATLVLDLDGTLIASEELNSANSAYLWNPHPGARAPDYEAMGRRVWLRPGVREFLTAVRPHFEIVLFTAATQNWATAAVEQLDPAAELFDVMLHRDHTTSDLMWDYVKDLSRLGRDLARVVIVDDNPLMFMYQPDNALHVAAYEAATAGGPDNVLERVSELLIGQVAPAEDVREVLGPMATAKTCILSTIAPTSAATATAAVSAPAAAATQMVAGSQAAPCAATMSSAPDAAMVACDADSAAAGGAVCAGGEGAADCRMDDQEASGTVPAHEGDAGEATADEHFQQHCSQDCRHVAHQTASYESGYDEECAAQEEEMESQADDNHCGGCTAEGSAAAAVAAADADGVAIRDGMGAEDSEEGAAVAFDANGAAAQLGAEDGPASYRHRDWEEDVGHAASAASMEDAGIGSEEVAVGSQSSPASGSDGGEQEQEESDASPAEELTEHSSEDFEALMEDAIAEYDSDAYGEQYDKDLSYDDGCPAATAAATATVAAAVTASARVGGGAFGAAPADSCDGFGRFRSSSRSGGSSSYYRTEAVGFACGSFSGGAFGERVESGHLDSVGADQHPQGHDVDANDVASVPVPFTIFAAEVEVECAVQCDHDLGHITASTHPLGITVAPASSTQGSAPPKEALAGALGSGAGEAVGALPRAAAPLVAGGLGEQLLPTRQSSFPSGMVFLTDLNPALGASGCVAAEPEQQQQQPVLSSCGAEARAPVVAPTEAGVRSVPHVSCKRLREEATEEAGTRSADACESGSQAESGVGEDGAPPPHRRSRQEGGCLC